MKFGIVTFPGSNCDYDAYQAVIEALGEEAEYLWHKNHDLRAADVVILPGGFSYGDYLRAGAIARFSPIMREVVEHARSGAPVLAICNGFQIACEAGLLPGALMRNAGLRFISDVAYLRVESTDTMFSGGYEAGGILAMPVAHGEGRYVADPGTLQRLESEGRVLFRYVSPAGEVDARWNINGSLNAIAGIVNEGRNVLGMMPHPERAMDPLLGSGDGRPLFEGLLAAVNA
ncbi:MAG TPA: phosphoribosylformylglycinamidine synthase subunit PurQ [Gemmatimonadaceae bacterium]|nr:phosphoribosylformylglycinamidine synthase subunit PurQ [Gemmatimonadaceae bacterium]